MMLENFYYQLFIIIGLGLLFGSFYNVVIIRTLNNESIISPASKCPNCNELLLWWHKIPILSYILLKGKCWFCEKPIDIQYPIVELVTTGMFVSCFIKYGITLMFFKSIFILSVLLMLAVMDLKEKEIPHRFVLLLGFSLTIGAGINFIGLLLTLLLVGGGKLVLDKVYQKPTIGEGDVAVLAILGATGVNVAYLILFTLIAQVILSLKYLPKKTGMWFLASYAIVLADKICYVSLNKFILGLVYLNLIVSVYYFVKNLKLDISVALMPATFIGFFLCMITG